jgi:hypothetical protein
MSLDRLILSFAGYPPLVFLPLASSGPVVPSLFPFGYRRPQCIMQRIEPNIIIDIPTTAILFAVHLR